LLILNGRVNGLWFGSLYPDSPPIFLDDAQFAKLWTGASRVYLVTADEKKQASLANIGPAHQIAKAGGKFVLSNRSSEQ
jgi:hypothetical protein